MGWIIFGGFIALIVALKLCQKYHICQLGFHDKENVQSMDCNEYIKKIVMREIGCNFENIKLKVFNKLYVDTSSDQIRYSVNHKYVYDSVCMKCHKCFKQIEYEKILIEETVKSYIAKMKNKDIRKKIAEDLFNENCKES